MIVSNYLAILFQDPLCIDPTNVQLLNMVGSGAFGQVYKAVWRGTVVAAKVLNVAGNAKVVENELKVYR